MHECRQSARGKALSHRIVSVIVATGILWWIGTPVVHAQEERVDWTAHLRWGVEYDDNPHRLETEDRDFDDGQGAPLMRYLVGGDVLSELGSSGRMSAAIQHGATRFYGEPGANAALTEAQGAARWFPSDQFSVQLRGDVKDRSESGDQRRDYIRGGLALRVGRALGPVQLRADGGWRFLAYKPSPPSSHRGLFGGLGAQWNARNDLALSASWTHSQRDYAMTAWAVEDDRFVSLGIERADRFQWWQISARYQRDINARLRYQYARNRSNSHGQRMTRHGVEARVTVPVVWDVFASMRGEIQRTRYQDPVLFDDVLLLDEDHRNTLVAALNRRLAGPWDVELRYSLFTQEFGVGGDYRRQTVAVAIRAFFDGAE